MSLPRPFSRSPFSTLVLVAALAAPLAGCLGELSSDEESPSAVESTVTSSPTTLVRRGSNKCLDVNASSTSNGAKVQQWGCNGTAAQSFTIEDRGNGVYRVKNTNSGKCLDVTDGGTSNGT